MKERETQKDIKPDCLNVTLDGSHYVEKFVSDHIIVTLDFIPVGERLPDKELEFCIVLENRSFLGTAMMEDSLWWGHDQEGSPVVSEDVTHWAEMPTI